MMINEKLIAEEVAAELHKSMAKLLLNIPSSDGLAIRGLELRRDIQQLAQQFTESVSLVCPQSPIDSSCAGHKFSSGKQMAETLSCLVNERAAALQRRVSTILSNGSSNILYDFSIERDGWTEEQKTRPGRGGGPKPALARYVGKEHCPLCNPHQGSQVSSTKVTAPRPKHNKRFEGPKPIQAFDKTHKRIGSWESVTEASEALRNNRSWVEWFEINKPWIDLDSTTIRVGIGKAATANQAQDDNSNAISKAYGPFIWMWK